MTAVRITKLIAHAWLDLFKLVLDVESYPKFVPHCQEVRLISRKAESPARTVIISRMTVGFSVLRVSYANRTVGDTLARRINVEALDGPLRYLNVLWEFEAEDDHSCAVTFSVDYQFSSGMLESLASRVFSGMFAEILEAFERRAEEAARNTGNA